jgi:hypothetical protein
MITLLLASQLSIDHKDDSVNSDESVAWQHHLYHKILIWQNLATVLYCTTSHLFIMKTILYRRTCNSSIPTIIMLQSKDALFIEAANSRTIASTLTISWNEISVRFDFQMSFKIQILFESVSQFQPDWKMTTLSYEEEDKCRRRRLTTIASIKEAVTAVGWYASLTHQVRNGKQSQAHMELAPGAKT